MVNRKTANNQVNMADLRLSANILFAQSIREKENSKELSFLSRIVNAVLSRETYPDSRKDKPHNYECGLCADVDTKPHIHEGRPRLRFCKNTNTF